MRSEIYIFFLDAMHLVIRKYVETDFQAIADIYNESIALGDRNMDCRVFGAEDVRQWVAKFDARETILAAEREGQIVGWGIIKRYSDRLGYRTACETSIYLALSETGKGYGSLIQQKLLERVEAFGYHHVVAKVVAANHRSIAFHQRFGFEMVGVQKEIGYLRGRWHDVAILQLILPHVPPYQPDLGKLSP